MKRITSIVILTILCIISSSNTVYAQERPLSQNNQIIQEQSDRNQEKSILLQNTSQQIEELEAKKQTLTQQLADEQKTIADLKQKLVEKQAAIEAEQARLAEVKAKFVHITIYASDSAGNTYAPGNCTWYVKSRRADISNSWGNANTWYYRAEAQGWHVGSAPKKGAVGTTTRGSLGHVVYVEGLNPDGTITISEMNYSGLYSVRERIADPSEFVYIYEL